MKNTKKGRPSGIRIAMIVLCALLAIVLIAMLGVSIYVQKLLDRVNYVQPEQQETMSSEEVSEFLATLETEPEATGPTMDESEIDWGKQDLPPVKPPENIINIMLIGQDARPGQGRSRSDVMVLCTINKKTQTVTLTSFLRDIYVQIPGFESSKLTHTYVWGGMELLDETIEQNFGIHIDGNLEVNFERFTQLIDLLGGVDIELRNDEADYINYKLGYAALCGGKQHLNGEQALWYSRIRYLDPDADISRSNRHRKVLIALIEQFRNADLPTLLNLMEEAMPMITTDMTQEELVTLATELFPMLANINIVSQRLPGETGFTLPTIKGMAVVLLDMDKAREYLATTLGLNEDAPVEETTIPG